MIPSWRWRAAMCALRIWRWYWWEWRRCARNRCSGDLPSSIRRGYLSMQEQRQFFLNRLFGIVCGIADAWFLQQVFTSGTKRKSRSLLECPSQKFSTWPGSGSQLRKKSSSPSWQHLQMTLYPLSMIGCRWYLHRKKSYLDSEFWCSRKASHENTSVFGAQAGVRAVVTFYHIALFDLQNK